MCDKKKKMTAALCKRSSRHTTRHGHFRELLFLLLTVPSYKKKNFCRTTHKKRPITNERHFADMMALADDYRHLTYEE